MAVRTDLFNPLSSLTGPASSCFLKGKETNKNGTGIWALDPIDGTKGFLRGDQYAVCLALIVDGVVEVGALGCPNLPIDPNNPESEKGIMLSAVRGQGATIVRPYTL